MDRFEHKNIPVEVDESGQFTFAIEENEYVRPSYREAKGTIDKIQQLRAKRIRLNLNIMDSQGRPGVITGIHLGTGRPTIQGEARGGPYYSSYYPANAWITTVVEELRTLKERTETLNKQLGECQLDTRYYHAPRDPEGYTEALEDLRHNYQEKRGRVLQLAAAQPSEDV